MRLRDGTDAWEVTEIAPEARSKVIMVADRQTPAMKFFAEADE